MVTMTKPIEETYNDVERLIYYMSWQAARRFGGDVDDYISTANWAFMNAYKRYDESKGKFTTLLCHAILNKFEVQNRPRCKDALTNSVTGVKLDSVHKQRGRLDKLFEDLSDDARTMALLVLGGEGGSKRGIIEHFKSAGWTVARIVESFYEIREALSN